MFGGDAMITWQRRIACALRMVVVTTAALCLLSQRAEAVPAFARQTGLACVACHVSFPELTPFGRFFKLTGYTLTNNKTIPLAAML